MPGDSKIEWTNKTWNPVTGCTKVSAGCDHCYAEAFAERWRGIAGHPYEQGFDLRLWPDRLQLPLRWTKPSLVFVNSMSDLFHADVPTEFIDRVWAVMSLAPHHIFQVLTKRPQRMRRYLSDPNTYQQILEAAEEFRHKDGRLNEIPISDPSKHPHRNIWIGTSVENQEAAFRIDSLVKTPAEVRFLSCEPLIGPLDLDDWLLSQVAGSTAGPFYDKFGNRRGGGGGFGGQAMTSIPLNDIHWVIAGGESGPGHRPAEVAWFQGLADQCQEAGVPFFMKQDSGPRSGHQGRISDALWARKEFPLVRQQELISR